MEKTELGQTGIKVSRLGLGTVKFGRNEGVKYPKGFELPDEKHLAALLAQAKELGINLLDTAPAYGLSEERLGRLLTGQRKDWVIVSKAGEEFENGVSRYDFSAKHFEMSLERTLKRLQTDYVDALLIHSDGEIEQDLDDIAGVLQDFKKRGLAKAVGSSTKTIEGGLKAAEIFDVVMVTPDQTEVLDKAGQLNKGVLLKKILGSGHETDIQKAMRAAFVHKAVSAAIVGTITPAHLLQNVEALQKVFSSPSRLSSSGL